MDNVKSVTKDQDNNRKIKDIRRNSLDQKTIIYLHQIQCLTRPYLLYIY